MENGSIQRHSRRSVAKEMAQNHTLSHRFIVYIGIEMIMSSSLSVARFLRLLSSRFKEMFLWFVNILSNLYIKLVLSGFYRAFKDFFRNILNTLSGVFNGSLSVWWIGNNFEALEHSFGSSRFVQTVPRKQTLFTAKLHNLFQSFYWQLINQTK